MEASSSGNPERKRPNLGIVRDLYPLTNLEGDRNQIVFKAAKEIDKELSKVKAYIGVAPHGSMTDDYADENSDVDIMYVRNDDEPDNFKLSLMSDIAPIAAARASRSIGRKVQLWGESFSLKEFKQAVQEINQGIRKFPEDNVNWTALAVSVMSRLMKGNRVDTVRMTMLEALNTLSSEDKTLILNKAAKAMVKRDAKSTWKRLHRKTGAQAPKLTMRKEASEWKTRREKYWRERLEILWNSEKLPEATKQV